MKVSKRCGKVTSLVASAGLATALLMGAGVSGAYASNAGVPAPTEIQHSIVMADPSNPNNGGGSCQQDASARGTHCSMISGVKTLTDGNEYGLEGGGSTKGSLLLNNDGTINQGAFESLSSKEQGRFIKDIVAASDSKVGTQNITKTTQTNWLKQIQTTPGVGSKLLNEVLSQTKPDFVRANQIYAPFSGLVGTILGLLAVLLFAFLGIVMVLDLAYIVLPPVRMLAEGETGGTVKSKAISSEAIKAVQQAEEMGDGKGSGKSALGLYLKKRVWSLIILGICLLYLVQGQIYVAVGWILDMTSGFLGF